MATKTRPHDGGLGIVDNDLQGGERQGDYLRRPTLHQVRSDLENACKFVGQGG